LKDSTILEQLNSLSDAEKQEIISILSRSLIEQELNSDFDREELTKRGFLTTINVLIACQ
jgi:hypothetical protein